MGGLVIMVQPTQQPSHENRKWVSEEILAIITDFANSLESAAINLKKQTTKLQDLEYEFPEAPYNKLIWTDGHGQKGPYQVASARNNGNSDLYKHLTAILKQNNGRFSEKPWRYYYWL